MTTQTTKTQQYKVTCECGRHQTGTAVQVKEFARQHGQVCNGEWTAKAVK